MPTAGSAFQATLSSSTVYQSLDQFTLASDGNLYGIGTQGGANNEGYIYKVTPTPPSTTPQILYSFGATSNDATAPRSAPVQGADGALYGLASNGIYRITLDGAESLFYPFGTNPGDLPGSQCASPSFLASIAGPPTVGSDGNFYLAACSSIYQITLQGQVTILYTLTVAQGQTITSPLLQASDGNFYGITAGGGANNFGTVFRFGVPASH